MDGVHGETVGAKITADQFAKVEIVVNDQKRGWARPLPDRICGHNFNVSETGSGAL